MDSDRIEGKLEEAEGRLTDGALRIAEGKAQSGSGKAKVKPRDVRNMSASQANT